MMESPILANEVVLRRYFAAVASFIGASGLLAEAAGWVNFAHDLNHATNRSLNFFASAASGRELDVQALLAAKLLLALIVFWLACFAGLLRYVRTHELTTLPQLIDEMHFLQVEDSHLDWVRTVTTTKLFFLVPLLSVAFLVLHPFRQQTAMMIANVQIAPLLVLKEAAFLILMLLVAALIATQLVQLVQ